MEVKEIDWTKEGGKPVKICCPLCGGVWLHEEGEDGFSPCSHLRFAWVDAAGVVEYFGAWDIEKFEEDYRTAAIKVFCAEEPDGCEDEDFDEASPESMDIDVLNELVCDELSSIYEFSESHVGSCGPGGVTVYYGVKA